MIIPEELIQFIWANQLFQNNILKTDEGEIIQVLHQGIWNKLGSGPDFKDARLKIGEYTLAGAVEIHLNSGDWNKHGHRKDEAYNQVVLHVTYKGKDKPERHDGSIIPNLELSEHISDRLLLQYFELMNTQPSLPCAFRIKSIPKMELNSVMDLMSVERLSSKFERFDALLQDCKNDWSTLLYRQIVRSFGLPSNTEAFYQIAKHAPLDIIVRHSKDLFQLEAIFLGISGLLETPKDSYSTRLRKEFDFLQSKYGVKPISVQLQTGGMRPMSLPSLKLAQLASLFHKHANIVQDVLLFPDIYELQAQFNQSCSPYWDTHYVIGKESKFKVKSISKKAFHIVMINAIVPVLFLYARKRGLAEKEDIALEYLQLIPAEEHRIIRIWEEFEIRPESAQDSQGLLHLYKTYCTFKRCLNCRIGKYILSKA